jgi:hypothetical protein
VKVELTAEADRQLRHIPVVIVVRMRAVFTRLESWPDVSGAKPLRGNLTAC